MAVRDLPESKAVTFCVTGESLEQLPLEVESLDAASACLPSGAYTTLRTYERRKVLRLDDHLERLVQSARRLDAAARVLLTHAQLRHALGLALDRTGFAESRVRITLAVPKGDLFISVQPFDLASIPPELFQQGVAVMVCPFVRHETQAKATTSIASLHGVQATLPAWAHEGIMADAQGRLLEGLTCNFFAVFEGVLRTANENIVVGTTRALVLQVAQGLVPVALEPVRVRDLDRVSECFITSVSREVLPVVRVDDRILAEGRPGAVTLELLRRFRAHVRAQAETV
jgi:branched-chain amino acid aminotransferase